MKQQVIDTRLATVERTGDHLIVVRIKPGSKLDTKGFAEILATRKELAGDRPAAVICIIPEDVDFDTAILTTDHHKGANVGSFTKVMAIVSEGSLFERLSELYFAFHPPEFTLKVFRELQDAIIWVDERMAEGNRA